MTFLHFANAVNRLTERSLKTRRFLEAVWIGLNACRDRVRYGTPLFLKVSIENSSYCNRRCSYCPNSIVPPENNFMDERTFQKIVAELARLKFKGVFVFNGYNEPLLDPRLTSWVSYLRRFVPNTRIQIATNGDYLTMGRMRQLVEAGVSQIVITVHDAVPDRSLTRLRPIVEAFPHVANLLTAGQLLMVNRGGVVAIPPQFHLYTGPCCYLLAMSFDWRGNAILCMNDLRTENPITFGNIHDTGLLELWANPRYIALRRSIRRNSGLPPVCAKCLVNFTP